MSIGAMTAFDIAAGDDASRVIRRSYGLRLLGLTLGAVMVGAVLYRREVALSVWVLLALHALVWPHAAWWLQHRSREPIELDQRCFLGDAAMGGVWIALMQFNLLPSVLLMTMFSITLIATDGGRILLRGLVMLTLACGVAAVANGLAFAPDTGTLEMLASLPLLVVFPMVLGIITHGLARRVYAQNRELLQMSSVASLSGLLNRRHWEDAVNAALARHCCDNAVLLLIDIDHFKHVNDQHGHTVGDEVIRKVGAIIRGSLCDGDLAGRYGGDEFGVMLCGADLPAAATVAERIRSGVACSLIERTPGLRCTLSIGLARNQPSTHAAHEWVKDADAALYRAKLAGRNRLAMAN